MKHIIPILIVLLLLSSGFVGVSNTADEVTVNDELLDNLAFYYYDEYDSSKFEYYKEYFQRENSEITDLEEITFPVESPQTSVSSGPMDSPWPMKCHDTHHTSRSPYSTANITGLEKWRFYTNNWVEGGPIIGEDGTIYFGDFEDYLHALNPDGTEKWKYKTGNWIFSVPALYKNMTIYVTSFDGYLHALNSTTGAFKWKFGSGASIFSSPVIAEDGTIYFGNLLGGSGYRIYAISPNGSKKWHYDTGGRVYSDPAIGDDGTIYVGSDDTYLYALYPDGTLRWRFKTGDYVKGPPSIANDGTIYVGSYDDYLYAVLQNGTEKWKCKVGYGTATNPSIASDGTIYCCGSKVYAIYPNGTMRWSYDMGGNRHIDACSPAISADGTIYVGTNIGTAGDGGEIIAVNPDGTEKWRKKIADEWVESSPCIGEDGTVYIGSSCDGHGYLHAFGPVESNGPPEKPTISGETNGEAGKRYWYALRAVDPDNNPVSFYIDWGDGDEGWNLDRASGETYYYQHTWSEKGNYTIRVKAKDTLGEESGWAYLEVTMPMNQNQQIHNTWWFLQFLQNHPRIFPMLRYLFRLE